MSRYHFLILAAIVPGVFGSVMSLRLQHGRDEALGTRVRSGAA